MRKLNVVLLMLVAGAVAVAASLVVTHRRDVVAREEAPLAEKKPPFVIALLPEQNVFVQKKRYQPLGDYLSKKLGLEVRFKLLDSYASVLKEIEDKKVNGAFFGSFNFVMTNLRSSVEVIARPLWNSGDSTYRGVIFTRRDSGLTSDVKSWQGKRMAFVSAFTTAGYLYPVAYLRKNGVEKIESYFSKIFFTGSHDTAALMVFNRQADVGAAKDQIFAQLVRKDPAFRDAMVILGTSDPVPSNGLAIRSDVAPAVKTRLKEVLLGMDRDAEGQKVLEVLDARKFIETTVADYEPVNRMAREAGIDLKTMPISDSYVPYHSPSSN